MFVTGPQEEPDSLLISAFLMQTLFFTSDCTFVPSNVELHHCFETLIAAEQNCSVSMLDLDDQIDCGHNRNKQMPRRLDVA